ncbi:MAG: hypothetical protein GXP62_06765 [Oligoflexia bacterium]|nr:hypothetical protein [Oligoflexia bacterium]
MAPSQTPSPVAVRVPADFPDLAQALASGAAEIVIDGVVSGGLEIDRPVSISGTPGAVLRAEAGICLVLSADVLLRDLRIENTTQHGVIVHRGAPTLERCVFAVGDTAIGCDGQSRPRLHACRVERCLTGLFVTEKAAPVVQDLDIVATGGGMLFASNALGHLAQVSVVSGQFAAVEVRDQAAPVFDGLVVLTAETSALFLHDSAAAQFSKLQVQRTGGVAIEIMDRSTATLRSVRIEGAAGSGVFVHGQARPVLKDIEIVASGLSAIEAAESADPTIDGLSIIEPRGSGLFLHDHSRGTWLDVRVQGAALAGIEVADFARPELENVVLFGGQQSGLWVHGQAQAEVLGAQFSHQTLAAIEVAESGRLVLEDAVVRDTRGVGLRVLGHSQATLARVVVDDCGGDALVASDTARVDWTKGAVDATISAANQARVTLRGVRHQRLAPSSAAVIDSD